MARFRVNTPGVKRIYTDPLMQKWVRGQAEEVAREARRLAPVRTGAYRRSIKATVVVEDGRWVGRVNAFDFKALWVEFGTNGIRKSRVLGTALDVVGSSVKVGL